jgi:hypothetical protein
MSSIAQSTINPACAACNSDKAQHSYTPRTPLTRHHFRARARGAEARFQSSNKTDKSRPNENKDGGKVMKILNAKVVESRKEEPGTEPDRRADTWLIEGKLEQDIMGWENMKIDVPAPEVGAEIVETTMADAKRFTIRTRGEPKVHKGSRLAVTVREAQTA